MSEIDLSEEIQELVRNNGDEVAIKEPPCVLWKAEHGNCVGCKYELGCGKVVRLMLIMMIPMMYKPTSFADHQTMENRIQELIALTLKTTTPDELRAVPTS